MTDLIANLRAVRERVAAAAARSGRQARDVRLIAVSKTRPLADVEALAAAGQVDFGESTIQDASTKIPHRPDLSWHLIGHLQSNKTRFVPGLFDWVHSVDSEKLAARIARAAEQQGKVIKVLLQVNVSGDPAKYGFGVDELFAVAERLLEKNYAGIRLKGLMTIGRRGLDEAGTRRSFSDLRELARGAAERFGEAYFDELSMGMSGDYEIAIEEGATQVRVGTGLFGERGGR